MNQINVFELMYEPYKIKMPIRLIECFAGIGSQAKALERLGVNFEHHKVVEFDKYAIQSYNAIHGTNFETSDITKIHARDLEITDISKYTYLLTYSFPCQDLSLAGKQKGMKKGSGTRSGLLWEVERLLDECIELNGNLPQVLLMENVPEVIGAKNIDHFKQWQRKLETLGYSNYCEVLNAKDYGVPQNRKRCFMISVLGDYYYEFPKPFNLELRLKDMLEDEVDEKYFLNNEQIDKIKESNYIHKDPKCVEVFDYRYDEGVRGRVDKYISPTLTTKTGSSGISGQPLLRIPEAPKKGYTEAKDGDGVYINRPHQKRGVVQNGMIQTLKTSCSDVGVVVDKPICVGQVSTGNSQAGKVYSPEGVSQTLCAGTHGYAMGNIQHNLRIRKLTPLECYRLMGFDDEDFYKAEKVNSNTQLYKQAGNSIVVNVLEHIFKQLL